MSIRVLVADDQSMVRAGFRMLLTGEQDIEVVAEASNGREAVALTERFSPAVVLMDIRMPEIDGLEATRRILAANSAARILILTTSACATGSRRWCSPTRPGCSSERSTMSRYLAGMSFRTQARAASQPASDGQLRQRRNHWPAGGRPLAHLHRQLIGSNGHVLQ